MFCNFVALLLPLTFHGSHGLNEIDLAGLGSQRSRPVLDHPPVENPLDRRRGVSQDPTLQRGVGALDGLHHGGDDVEDVDDVDDIYIMMSVCLSVCL